MKSHQMSEASEFVLPVGMLRTAIRAKLRRGTSRQAISLLIRKFVPDGVNTERRQGQVYRLPVEVIPLDRRLSFLDALNELPNRLPAVATGIDRLAS